MAINNKVKQLYDALKADGGDVGTPEEFNSWFFKPEKEGYQNRKSVYDTFKADGAEVGKSYEEFGKWLGLHAVNRKANTPQEQPKKQTSTPMTAADRARFLAGANDIRMDTSRFAAGNANKYNQLKSKQKKKQSDFGRVTIGSNRTPFAKENNVVKNEALGTYVTSDNEETDNLSEAQQRQAALDEYGRNYQQAVDAGELPSVFDVRDKNGNYDLQENIGKNGTYLTEEGAQNQLERKLEDAYARKKEIEEAIAEDNRKNGNPLLSYSGSIGAGNGRDAESSDYRNKLATSLALVKQEIGALEAVKQYPTSSWGEDAWKALDNTAFTAKTWDFGLSDFATMGQMERIKTKMDNGIALTDSDKMLLKSKVGADAAAALEDEKMGNIYRWTKIAGQSLPFMMDFFLTGGYGGITKGISKAAIKYAAKKSMGKVSAAILKNTGVVAGDIIGSYAMATTTQAMKTGADVMQRHMGTLYQDENGNYAFGTFDENGNLLHEGGDTIGKALYKGLTSAMVENYTEKLFGHNYGFKKGAINFMEKHGMARSAEFLKNLGQKGWYAGSKKWMEKFGINGFAEEVMEEEIGIPLHALLDGEGKVSDLLDARQQLDIIGGMAISVGSMYAMGAGMRPVKGVYNRAQYYRFKHKVDASDSEAQQLFGDSWDDLKEQINNTTNEKMGSVLYKILQSRSTMTKGQIDAAVQYGVNLMKMRGYNLAKTAEMQARQTTGEPVTDEEQKDNDIDDAYSEGHNTEGAATHTIQLEQNEYATALAKELGITEEQLHNMSDEELEAKTGQSDRLDQAIYDYQMSTAKYQGVMDNANDKVDMAARQAAQRIDQQTDLTRGTVRNATIKGMKGEADYGVFIISGNLATHEDGTIDISGSDKMILYFDPKTGRKDYADASRFASLDAEVPADEAKAQAVNEAKEKAIREVAGIIDGKVDVGSQFVVTDEQGNQHTYEILADNGDGTAMITIDGNVPTQLVNGETVQIPMSFDDLQQMKDIEDEKTMAAARQQREEQMAQREEQKKADEQKQEQDENHLRAQYNNLLDNDGKVVMGTVHDGKHDDQQAFIVGVNQSNKKPYVIFLNEDGSFTKPKSFAADQVEFGESVDFDTFKAMMPEVAENTESTDVVENSGEYEPQPIGTSVFGNVYNQFKGKVKEAFSFLMNHKSGDLLGVFHRDDVGDIDLVWGDAKMGLAHILEKHIGEGKDFETIDDAISMIDEVIRKGRIFQDTENRYTLMLDGIAVGIRKNFDGEKKNWVVTAVDFNRTQEEKGIATNPTSTSHGANEPESTAVLNDSDGKDINNSANDNENNITLTLEDGTVVPIKEDGNPDFSQLTAQQTAELYESQFGEDAEGIISSWVSDAKKALDKANNMTVKGSNFVEQMASKQAKEAAIADAQAKYDSAKAIADAYQERQMAKEEDSPEGRMSIIEKARRKFNRMKSGLSQGAVAKLYNDVVGSVLHRLYDSTGIDVLDDTPMTAEEYVASNLGAFSLNYEGTETAKGVKQETGLSRADFAKTRLLASDGKGMTMDAMVHSLWEHRPEHLQNLDDQDIRKALIDVITSGFNAKEAKEYVQNLRIAQAESILEEQKRAAEDAAYAEEQRKAEEEKNTQGETPAENSTEETAGEETQVPDTKQVQTEEGTAEVPADATAEKPLGEQKSEDDTPFSPRDNAEEETPEQRAANIERNRVDNIKTVDNIVGEKTRKALERIAKMMGAKIQWQYTDSMGNGWYNADTNTLYLTLDSSITEGVQFIFGHEMTHEIKTKNPAAYDELRELVKDMMGEDAFNAQTAATQKKYNEHGVMYSEGLPAYEEEVVADQIGYWLRDLNYAHTLALKMSHPLLAKIHEIINRIRMAFTGTEYTENAKQVMRAIEQAYVQTANGTFEDSTTGESTRYSLRQKPEPTKKGIGYKVFVLKDGKLYPPMVANPNGAETPVGVWLDADAAPVAGESKTGRPQVKQGGKGTQGGSGKLAYRPGWHLGVIPYALQFNRKDAEGNKTLFPANFVFAEVEYAADKDYQEEAHAEGVNANGKYQHSLAGLKHLPTDGYYMYRTNPNPETDPWVITGAMKVNRILTRAEQADLVKNAGREPQQIQDGDIVTDEVVNSLNQQIADAPKFSLKDNVKPIGKNQFGNVYDQFKGKPKEAFDFLLKNKGGYLKGVFHRDEIGDIDLTYGDAPNPYKGKGLAHIIRKHVETLKDFSSVDDAINTITDVISNGAVKNGSIPNTFDIEKDNYRVVVAADKNGNWVLTAFDYVNPVKKKKKGTATALPLSQSSDGAGAVAPNLSAAKIDNSSETDKGNAEKFSLKDEDAIENFAKQYGVDMLHVATYVNAMKRKDVHSANWAMASMRVALRHKNSNLKLSEFKKVFEPIKEELYARFGNAEELEKQYRQQVAEERNVMEAARKKAEEEEAKRQKHLDELAMLSDEELDKRYMGAIEKNDEATAREMLDESARRKGYTDVGSDYQGEGAWVAPSKPDYESDEARRADVEDNAPNVNLEDMALGYTLQPDDYFTHPERYSQNTPHGMESVSAVKDALDALKRGERDVKVKVYRAVPTSVKEGKLRNGDWVTPSKKYAEMHGNSRLDGKYRIIEDEVPADQLWWDGNDANEFGFDDGKDYRYKNAKNNRKLNDLVTYDDKGNIIPPSKRFNSRKADVRFSLAGERGAANMDKAEEVTTRLDNLSVARKMEEEKKDAKAIKLATGWERGADGKWRYEIPDFKFVDSIDLSNPWKYYDLYHIMDAESLKRIKSMYYQRYAPMPEVHIRRVHAITKEDEEKRKDAIIAYVDKERNGKININLDLGKNFWDGNTVDLSSEKIQSTLNHEMQHVIQLEEGFATGGNVLKSNYRNLAGEVEARNVEARMGMTDEQRRNSLASETEDVAREDQIFLGVDGGDTKFSIKQFGTDIANASDRIKDIMNNEKIISRRIGSRAQAQSRVLETLSRASSDYRRANQASARSGQDTWEKDRALGHVIQASYETGAFLTEEELGDILGEKVGEGNENHVYRSKDGNTVFKLNNLLMVDKEFRFNEFVDRFKAHNEFAANDMYAPIGFALNQEGDLCLVLEQPYVQDGIPATQEEIDDYMEEHGYDIVPIQVSADEVGAGWSNGEFEIWDTKPRNVLKDKNGDLHFIDTVIQHTFINGHNDKMRFSLRVDQFQHDLEQWKRDNNLPKDAQRPAIPVREPNETAVDFAKRVKEYRRQMALWKTAPQYEGHLLTDDTAQGQFNLEFN